MRKILWNGLGWTAVALGVVGAFLPLLPTTPFLLLAAFAFSKGSEKLHNWLVNHPKLGPPITNWQTRGAISRGIKVYATLSMAFVFALAWLMSAPLWGLFMQATVLVLVCLFIWTRPER
ncbi:MAG: uncharacterized membrane protein YbaN (DUF454 family) [Limisphaerales bacterium]|jgi:uncharacterized membrane protein YbaN (DUF454 family)